MKNVFCSVCIRRHPPGECLSLCHNCGIGHLGVCTRACHNCGRKGHLLAHCSAVISKPPPRRIVEHLGLQKAGLYRHDMVSGTWEQIGFSVHHANLWGIEIPEEHRLTPDRRATPPNSPPRLATPLTNPTSSAWAPRVTVGVKRRRFVTETEVIETTREVEIEAGDTFKKEDERKTEKRRRVGSPKQKNTLVKPQRDNTTAPEGEAASKVRTGLPQSTVDPIQRFQILGAAHGHGGYRGRNVGEGLRRGGRGGLRGVGHRAFPTPQQLPGIGAWGTFNAQNDDALRSLARGRERMNNKLEEIDRELGWDQPNDHNLWADED